jgi:Asp-tRNA(Asn)/Glu-tRNA(Gln) amidotransferase A subunit family amidase
VAAGFCPLALGSQTIGSVIRPAAYCGTVGFKPTFNRIPVDGVIPFAPSLDHAGFFTGEAEGLSLIAAMLCRSWRPREENDRIENPPAVGIPEGAYLSQAQPDALTAFEALVRRLQQAGCQVRRIPVMNDIEAINRRHKQLMAAEVAVVHRHWFAEHRSLYHPRTAAIIEEGASVGPEEQSEARAGQPRLRQELERLMAAHGIRAWICPAATGPAPAGIESTGDPLMNLPWTHTGMPAVTLPAGKAANGLPLGLQCVAAFGEDEWLTELACWLQPRLEV